MKLPIHIENFAQGNTDLYRAFKDYFNQSATERYGYKNLSFSNAVSYSEKENEVNELFNKEVKRISGVDFSLGLSDLHMSKNPQVSWAAFAIVDKLIDMVLPETIITSVGVYSNIQTVGIGDSLSIDIKPRELFAVSKGGRAKRQFEIKKQFMGQVTLVPEVREVSVGVSLYKVISGKESLADFVMKAVRSIETELTVDAYNTFNTAMTNLPTTPVGGELKITGYTQDAAVSMAQKVTAYNGGAKATFVGTQLSASKVLPAGSAYRYMLDSDYVKMGYIQTAFGYDVLVIPQVADYKNPHKLLLDDTRLYVLSPSSQKLVQIAIEDGTFTNTDGVFDNANLTQNATIRKAWACGIATNAIAGLIIHS